MFPGRTKRQPPEGIQKLFWCFILALLTLAALSILNPGSNAAVNTASGYVHRSDRFASKPGNPEQAPPSVLAIPAQGKLLIASRKLQDPRFRETVVFLVQYSPSGTMGLIINRPTVVRLADLIKDLPALKKSQDVAFYGGPVEAGRMFLLIQSTTLVSESIKVIEDVHMSTSRAVLNRLIAGKPDVPFRSYVGYAGWAPGQLEAEIAHGDWYVIKADARIIFEHDTAMLWPQLIQGSMAIQV